MLDVVIEPIIHDLILGKPWIFEHNARIDLIVPQKSPMSAKSFSRMIEKNVFRVTSSLSTCPTQLTINVLNAPMMIVQSCYSRSLSLAIPQTLRCPGPVNLEIELIPIPSLSRAPLSDYRDMKPTKWW